MEARGDVSGQIEPFRDRQGSVICGLCRYEQGSAKAWSSRSDMCLSCGMRGDKPKWLRTSGFAVSRWREAAGLTQAEMASACGWTQARQSILERQRKVNATTAAALARGFVRVAGSGRQIERVIREWPLFVLLVSHDDVAAACGGEEL